LSLHYHVDDSGMSASGNNHQVFSFHIEEKPLFPAKIIRFGLLPAFNEKCRGHFFLGFDPLDVPRKERTRNDLCGGLNFDDLESEGLKNGFLKLPEVGIFGCSGTDRKSVGEGLFSHVERGPCLDSGLILFDDPNALE
jgi:hypothetical protein